VTIIEIPFDFEFRRTKLKWSVADARITGWARRTDATVDGAVLMAEVTTAELTYPIKYPRKNIPDGRWDNLWLEAYSDSDVERAFASWQPMFLVPSGATYGDEVELRKHSQPADAWLMREEFLRLKPTLEEANSFLNHWGRWNFAEFLELREIKELQRAVRDALTVSPEGWFASARCFPPVGHRTEKYPYFTFVTDMCEVAVRLTVTIDLLRKTKFKLCAREDCLRPFPLTSKRQKDYCSRECGHLALVRRKRKKNIVAGIA
jgi:hypothetical protein